MGKKYLIVQLANLGDCLYATTIAKQLKTDEPDCHISWAIFEHLAQILLGNKDVDYIWKISKFTNETYHASWLSLKTEIDIKKNKGVFDEIIYSQILPDNLERLTTTIRGAILKSYKREITVSRNPIVNLIEQEKNKVKEFASLFKLQNYKNIILFECSPQSGQVNLNIEIATKISLEILKKTVNTCIILSSPHSFQPPSPHIIDGSKLSYRENLFLTNYCTLFVGCSSGITWLCTSENAKKLPMIQILSKNSYYFCGVNLDLKLIRGSETNVIEMLDVKQEKIVSCISDVILYDFNKVRQYYNQDYRPQISNLLNIIREMLMLKIPKSVIKNFISNFYNENNHLKMHPLRTFYFSSYIVLFKIYFSLKRTKDLLLKNLVNRKK